jgi:hypothetical protein
MWFKINNELINLNSVSNFTFDDNALQLKITYIGGEKKTFKYSTWPDFNSTKNNILNNCGLKSLKNGKLFPEDDRRLISYD